MDERNFAKIQFKTDFVRIFDIVTDPLVRYIVYVNVKPRTNVLDIYKDGSDDLQS